jgi:hypothetical protein
MGFQAESAASISFEGEHAATDRAHLSSLCPSNSPARRHMQAAH